MPTFYMTVGVKYALETHPHGLHPDGWVEIEAPNYEEARRAAFAEFGVKWALVYPEEKFDRTYHARGCEKRIVAKGQEYGVT